MDLLDIVLIGLAALAAYSGYRRGALMRVLGWIGILAGLVLGIAVAPKLAGLWSSTTSQVLVASTSVLTCVVVGSLAGWWLGSRLRGAARRTFVGPIDAVGGAAISVLVLALVVWLASYTFAAGPVPALSRQIRGSAIVRGLDAAMPQPPTFLSQVRQFLTSLPFPQVFSGLPPGPGGHVAMPSPGAVRAAVRAAQGSTVRIEGAACGGVLEGSGFVVAPGYVVTNAHVVAGMASPMVQRGGTSQAGIPVLFDPRMDIALLHVASDPGPVLHLGQSTVSRGNGGAILGYPEGGNLTEGAAAVRGEITAQGRDIYGRASVTREIYDLQTLVRPGNSGGPFVLPDGQVAGVVFAASTTERNTGYALTSPEVWRTIQPGIGRTQAVSTQGCAR
jgi:S1-C subfamily serine protease